MAKYYLGCNIDFRAYESIEAAIEKELHDGMMLSALSSVTGVDASTVQNWVKRGYLENPQGKKYSQSHAARIILLNTLKEAVPLERAAEIIEKTVSDCKVSEKQLLAALLQTLVRATRFNSIDKDSLNSVVNSQLRDMGYSDKTLSKAVFTLALAALSASYRAQAAEQAQSL